MVDAQGVGHVNRQSLDATTADRMFRRFDDIFETCGWRVVTLKHGKLQREVFGRPGGQALMDWIDGCPNAEFAALTYQGGAAWRERLTADLVADAKALALVAGFDDGELARLMTNLGGHCAETLIDAFAGAQDDKPTLFIAYTVKGYGLPFAGHKDNHAGLMTEAQIHGLRDEMGIAAGEEWEPWAGLGDNAASALQAFVGAAPIAAAPGRGGEPAVPVPALAVPSGSQQSTQMAFGKILFDLAKSDHPLAQRIVTTSPDVTVSTNLGPWVNQRGLFRRSELADVFGLAKIPSTQKWGAHGAGQHIELGIAENNLFLMLAALGLSEPLFGARLLPIGTVYDPFIARGLDALNYGCYQDARFLLVATPSGLTLGPEGGAHQSINTPLIGMGQPGLTSFEPAFADELAACMEWAFAHMQEDHGGSVYLRLSTRQIQQAGRNGDTWKTDMLAGGYWLKEPKGTQAIVYMGALAEEAAEAWNRIGGERADVGLLAVTSPDLLHRDWSAAQAARARGEDVAQSHVEKLLAPLGREGRLIGVVDGSPSALSWLGGVHGQRIHVRGVDRFGQTGDLANLYREYCIDGDAIVAAARALFR